MTVRSGRVWGPSTLGTSATTALFTVPTDRTLIIREFRWLNFTSVDREVNAFVNGTGNGNRVVRSLVIPANSTTVQLPYFVLNAGDTFHVAASAATTINLMVSGALLQGDNAELPL